MPSALLASDWIAFSAAQRALDHSFFQDLDGLLKEKSAFFKCSISASKRSFMRVRKSLILDGRRILPQ